MIARDRRQLGGTVATLVAAVVLTVSPGAAESLPAPAPLELSGGERVLVVAPHPDDETLAAGGLMQRVLERGGSVRVVLITAGGGYVEAVEAETGLPPPRPAQFIAYGERRLREARAAVRELGGNRIRLQLLGFPDGGLAPLLHAHWRRSHPERSRTTGARQPPYPEALDPRVAYDGYDLRRELEHLVRETRPTLVVLPHPLDRHPDHHAAGLFTLLALADVAARPDTPPAPAPRLLAYLVHWPDWPPGWNAAAPLVAPDSPLELPATFPVGDGTRTALPLTPAEASKKTAAVARYETQQQAMPSLLAALIRRTEPFVLLPPAAVQQAPRLVEESATGRTAGRRRRDRPAPQP